MMQKPMRLMAGAALLCLTLGSAGCTRMKGYQGYVSDSVLVNAIQPGVDNRSSVEKTLGRPSFAGQFDANDWYYVSRQTKAYAFNSPKPYQTMVLRVRFDAAGNVASVDQAGLDRVVKIDPKGGKTPTLGKDRGFFEELFGNIGQVGAVGQGGGTADNPN